MFAFGTWVQFYSGSFTFSLFLKLTFFMIKNRWLDPLIILGLMASEGRVLYTHIYTCYFPNNQKQMEANILSVSGVVDGFLQCAVLLIRVLPRFPPNKKGDDRIK